MKIRELRSQLREFDQSELTEIIVEMYKKLPKIFIEEESFDELIVNRNAYLEARRGKKEEEKRLKQASEEEHVTSIAALQKWKAIPQYGRELLLNNVWCSECHEARGIMDYHVESAGNDIVLRGVCQVCHHDVARYVEID